MRRLWHWLFEHPWRGDEVGTNPSERTGTYLCTCGKRVAYAERRKA